MTAEDVRTRLLFAPVSALSDDELIEKGRIVFEGLVIGELRRALAAAIGVAAMTLAACAADFLTMLHSGRNSDDWQFGAFMEEYLPRYDAKRLRLTRHRLVHN